MSSSLSLQCLQTRQPIIVVYSNFKPHSLCRQCLQASQPICVFSSSTTTYPHGAFKLNNLSLTMTPSLVTYPRDVSRSCNISLIVLWGHATYSCNVYKPCSVSVTMFLGLTTYPSWCLSSFNPTIYTTWCHQTPQCIPYDAFNPYNLFLVVYSSPTTYSPNVSPYKMLS